MNKPAPVIEQPRDRTVSEPSARTQHTPGPWRVNDHDHDEQCLYIESESDAIATVFTDNSKSAHQNARLIAAAPDLLEALTAYVRAQGRMLDKWADGDDAVKTGLWRELHACEETARAALAKAQSGNA